jgi:hypothetical protein
LLVVNALKIAVDIRLGIGMPLELEILALAVLIVLVSIADKKWQPTGCLARPEIQKSEHQLANLHQNPNSANIKIVDM